MVLHPERVLSGSSRGSVRSNMELSRPLAHDATFTNSSVKLFFTVKIIFHTSCLE